MHFSPFLFLVSPNFSPNLFTPSLFLFFLRSCTKPPGCVSNSTQIRTQGHGFASYYVFLTSSANQRCKACDKKGQLTTRTSPPFAAAAKKQMQCFFHLPPAFNSCDLQLVPPPSYPRTCILCTFVPFPRRRPSLRPPALPKRRGSVQRVMPREEDQVGRPRSRRPLHNAPCTIGCYCCCYY